LAYSLREVENRNKGKSGRKDFGWMTGKKGGAFFRQGVLRKMCGKEAVKKKKEQKRVNCKIKMPMIFVKGSCYETPLYTMCWVTRTVIRDKL
jgi:hypothetical protein